MQHLPDKTSSFGEINVFNGIELEIFLVFF